MKAIHLLLGSFGTFSAASFACAQPALFTPGSQEASASYSYSSKADLELAGARIGEMEVEHYAFDYGVRGAWREDIIAFGTVSWSRDELSSRGAVPLPDELEAFSLGFGAIKTLSPEWSLMGALRPSMSSDEGAFSGNGFRLSAVLSIGRQMSPTFSWNAGLGASTEGEYPVLPVLGLQWGFAPKWMLSFGFPRTEVTYRARDGFIFNAGLRVQGGDYAVSAANSPGLGDTQLSYREIRVGGGFVYRPSPLVELRLDGGLVIDRRFDYYDRDVEVKGDRAAYVELAMKIHF